MDRKLTVGDVISGTLDVVGDNRQAALLFVVVMTAIGSALQWGIPQTAGALPADNQMSTLLLTAFGIGAGIGGIVLVILTVIVSYLLWEVMLRRAGHLTGDRGRRFLAYFGQAILIALGTGFGFVLLIVPGLIVMARWAAAPAYLIAGQQGITEAMGSSWDELKGNTTPVVFAVLIVFVVFLVVGGTLGAASGFGFAGEEPGLLQVVVEQLLSHLGSVLGIGLGVYLFGRLHASSEALSEVFE